MAANPTPATTEVVLPTVEEVMSSLTGFDQIAIRVAFKMSLGQLQETDALQLLYALAFILNKRDGQQDQAAFAAAQALTLTEVQARFGDEADADLEGKGD